MKKAILFLVMLLFVAPVTQGDEIRAHVDANGNVTYKNSGPTIQEQQKRDIEQQKNIDQVNKPQVQKKVISTLPRPNRPDIHGMPPNEARTRMEGYRIEMNAYMASGGTVSMPSRPNISGMPPNEARTRMEGYRIEMEAYMASGGTVSMPAKPNISGLPPNEARTRMEGYRIEMEAYSTSQGGTVRQTGGNIISENHNLKKQYEIEEAEDDARRSEQNRQESSKAQSNHGAIDQHGNFYAPAAGGIIDQRDGTFHQEAAGGYINTKTGEFMPAQ